MRNKGYLTRHLVLNELGYSSYKVYLKSKLWKGIRGKVLKGKKCKCCRYRKATQVHHKRYNKKTMLGKDLEWLVPLCFYCHKAIEYNKDGTKVKTLAAVNCKLTLLTRKHRRVKNVPRRPIGQSNLPTSEGLALPKITLRRIRTRR